MLTSIDDYSTRIGETLQIPVAPRPGDPTHGQRPKELTRQKSLSRQNRDAGFRGVEPFPKLERSEAVGLDASFEK